MTTRCKEDVIADMLVLWDDGTWSTESVVYPGRKSAPREKIVSWFEDTQLVESRFRRAIGAQLGWIGYADERV
jgi:hypothetical protein